MTAEQRLAIFRRNGGICQVRLKCNDVGADLVLTIFWPPC